MEHPFTFTYNSVDSLFHVVGEFLQANTTEDISNEDIWNFVSEHNLNLDTLKGQNDSEILDFLNMICYGV